MSIPVMPFQLSSAPLWQALRQAARRLGRSPGFAFLCVATLALCIGAVTAIFSVVYGVVLQPYGFGQQGKLVVWHETVREMQGTMPLAPVNYRHFRNLVARSRTLRAAALLQPNQDAVSVGASHPQVAPSLYVTQNFFSVMQAAPAYGRFFLPGDFEKGGPSEVVLSWEAWQRFFPGQALNSDGGNPLVHPVLRIGGFPYTVVGVLPASFRFPPVSIMPGAPVDGTSAYSLFLPHVPVPAELTADDSEFNYVGIGRLRPGVSIAAAQSELDGIEKATTHGLPIHLGVAVASFGHEVTGSVQKPLLLLLLAVAGVLLIGCINLASLQLARSLSRQSEQALRSALGAPRLRLLQDALAENLLLACIGGIAAIAVGFVGLRALVAIAPSGLPRLANIHLNLPVLVLAALLSLTTSIAFGILPALRALRTQPIEAMQGAGGRVVGHGTSGVWLRHGILATQIGCSVVLLVATGVVTQSFGNLLAQAHAFNGNPVTLAQADLQAPQYSDGGNLPDNAGSDPGSLHRDATIDETLRRLSVLPGVRTAALTSVLPLTGDISVDGVERPDHPLPQGQTPMANLRMVSPGYFRALGIPLEQGRNFEPGDRDHARVAIVSAATGPRCLGERKPTRPYCAPLGAYLHRDRRRCGRPHQRSSARCPDLLPALLGLPSLQPRLPGTGFAGRTDGGTADPQSHLVCRSAGCHPHGASAAGANGAVCGVGAVPDDSAYRIWRCRAAACGSWRVRRA